MRRAVFMDRDGVLNHTVLRGGRPFPPAGMQELELSTGVQEGCRRLTAAGYALVGITNQPDVARGVTRRDVVEEINAHLMTVLGIAAFKVCYHDDADHCACRKPKPGLILQAASEMRVDLSSSFMIGDRWKDVEAGRLAGCSTILIENEFAEAAKSRPTHTVTSFQEAVTVILGDTQP